MKYYPYIIAFLVCSPGEAVVESTQISCSPPPPPSPTLPHPPKQICESSRPYQESKVGVAPNPCNTRRIILTTCSAVFFHPFVFPVSDLGKMFQRRPVVVLNEEQGSKDNGASFDFFQTNLCFALFHLRQQQRMDRKETVGSYQETAFLRLCSF